MVKILPPNFPLTSFCISKILAQVVACVIYLWGIWIAFYCLESCRGHTALPNHNTCVYLKCPIYLQADAISSQLPVSAHCSCIYHSGTSCCSYDNFSVSHSVFLHSGNWGLLDYTHVLNHEKKISWEPFATFKDTGKLLLTRMQ